MAGAPPGQGERRGAVGTANGPRNGLDVLLAGLVVEILDAPFCAATLALAWFCAGAIQQWPRRLLHTWNKVPLELFGKLHGVRMCVTSENQMGSGVLSRHHHRRIMACRLLCCIGCAVPVWVLISSTLVLEFLNFAFFFFFSSHALPVEFSFPDNMWWFKWLVFVANPNPNPVRAPPLAMSLSLEESTNLARPIKRALPATLTLLGGDVLARKIGRGPVVPSIPSLRSRRAEMRMQWREGASRCLSFFILLFPLLLASLGKQRTQSFFLFLAKIDIKVPTPVDAAQNRPTDKPWEIQNGHFPSKTDDQASWCKTIGCSALSLWKCSS